MGQKMDRALLPMDYDTYVFDLYGTLVDIHTDEELPMVWEKLALFYGCIFGVIPGKRSRGRRGIGGACGTECGLFG